MRFFESLNLSVRPVAHWFLYRLAAEGRPGSPLVGHENGYISDDNKTKGKSKSKAKRTGAISPTC